MPVVAAEEEEEWRARVVARSHERAAALSEFMTHATIRDGFRLPLIRPTGTSAGAVPVVSARLADSLVDHLAALQRHVRAWHESDQSKRFVVSTARLGAVVHGIAARQSEEDADIFALLGAFALANDSPALPYREARTLLEPRTEEITRLILAGRWYGAGLPSLRIDARLAAALVFTDLPSDLVNELSPPFPTFQIEIPHDLLPDGPSDHWTRALVAKRVILGRTIWTYQVESTSGDAFIVTTFRLAELATAWRPEHEEAWGLGPQRILELVGRLVMGTCTLAATERTKLRRAGKGGPKWSLSREPAPVGYVLESAAAVAGDFVDAVRDYATGAARARRALAWPVRGHWRNQPHGPESSLRKRLWIQPFWKGEAAALIATGRGGPCPGEPNLNPEYRGR